MYCYLLSFCQIIFPTRKKYIYCNNIKHKIKKRIHKNVKSDSVCITRRINTNSLNTIIFACTLRLITLTLAQYVVLALIIKRTIKRYQNNKTKYYIIILFAVVGE